MRFDKADKIMVVVVVIVTAFFIFLFSDGSPTETCEQRWTDTNGNTHCGHMRSLVRSIRPDSLGKPVTVFGNSDIVATHTEWYCKHEVPATDSTKVDTAQVVFYLSIIRPVVREYEEAK